MRYLEAVRKVVTGALCLVAASSLASAQVQVSTQTERTSFLLFERVDLLVTVSNIGDTDLLLSNNEGHPWLSFLVSEHLNHNYMPVRQERDSNFAPLTLKAGENKTLRVNLTPLFTFREEGDFRASAVIDLPGEGQVISNDTAFTVLKGREVWSQMRPVDGSQRVYSLLRFSPDPTVTDLYLRVADPSENLVYANLGLGELVAYIDPEVFFDPQGNIHVLHPFAMGTYLYTRADPDGKIIHQGIFKTFHQIPPRLHKLDDGNVIVVGGMEDDPNAQREKLSDGQLTKSINAPATPSPASSPVPMPAAAPSSLDTTSPATKP